MKKENQEQLDFEIQFYEGIMKKDPTFIEALVALGELYTKKGDYSKGLQIDKKLAAIRPEDPAVLYNLACSYSLLNDIDQSFEMIQKAVRHGYDNFKHMANDEDLNNLRSDERFKKYFLKIRSEKETSK